ncbi:MAG: hypothetical protein Q7V62_08155 [Actinomycetota bacterium]|nr:hypothetical protein [Actinomycetota bacterium]
MADSGKRPFWMHQLVEYILGVALLASGMQSPQPIVPSLLGGIIIMHAAITRGSLAAFRVIDRRLHRVLDPFIIGLQFFAAVQPWVSVDNGTRAIIAAIAVVHAVVWVGSSYTEKKKLPKSATAGAAPSTPKPAATPAEPADRATSLGQSAGRFVGSGVRVVRNAKAKRAGE